MLNPPHNFFERMSEARMTDEHDEDSDCQQLFYTLANLLDFALRSHDPFCVVLHAMKAIGCTLNGLDIDSHREGLEVIREATEIIEQELQERLGKEMSVV